MRAQANSPEAQRLDRGRFTVVAFPADLALARSLLDEAARTDTFPGLPRPRARALIAIAPDTRHFREWTGTGAPDWGAAIAIPDEHRIVMQGSSAGSDAGDPRSVLRHELAHLALHEALGSLPPRWFDEGYAGYAAGEWSRDEVLSANFALVLYGIPASLDSLEDRFHGGASRASGAYALAYRAVSDLAALDPQRGLSLFFAYWKQTGSIDQAMRRAFGLTKNDFESEWRSRTMRRYGLLALAANLSLLFALLAFLLLPLLYLRRRRDRLRMDALRAAEAASEAATAAAIAATSAFAKDVDS
ncbi:MAG: hypothetical protein M3Y30_00705 [Gemmatimonadota bacterium]|nr:hypothetical protein [Gemmatimonadota bacterium]